MTGNSRGAFISLFYAGIWLVFLIQPVQSAWAAEHPLQRILGVLSTVAFAAVYLLYFLHAHRGWSWGEPRRPSTAGVINYTVLALLAVACTVTVGQPGSTTWVFLAVTGMWTFQRRTAWLVAIGLIALDNGLAAGFESWTFDPGTSFAILLAMAAMTGGIMAAARERDLSSVRQENARLAVQDERNRMARDLHDILGHSLTVITVKAELAGRLMDDAPDRAKAEIADLERLSRDALADVRRAVEGYREISLAGELARAREALDAAGIHATLPNATDAVPSDLRELFAWVVREGVTNVIRHSGAEHCSITLDESGITIRDDGRGRGEAPGQGNGLAGARERASDVGAVLVSRDLSPHGFELVVTTPGPSDHRVESTADGTTPERSASLPILGRKARTS
ncbi:sensor histidine kinase [Segeticoccus rhizosphaerae]|uniref:sensor histidine kinase n=1 Tax=Segeticoccus rhizosphaerae TaxID=1104777 RepID=UPI00193AC2B6|nr:sensor histidine kinase [Segeticoccus rhizosphaerae]